MDTKNVGMLVSTQGLLLRLVFMNLKGDLPA